ncbi:MAG: type IV toxin-antitoxin system AbiEi family antitoxin [Methanoregula sp.]|jgi:hypothetical protein|uniref:type IV toxin-antitoxin system AbiEi family antitoxin n=1 Tax=Methanoregula sp. TaxID=2052170 RepID=UPI0025EAACF6|nr:type IV toxin-antitoxin system AbiEi family antitoxin [Methanoregula sp.]MCK9631981.1 type IV toxin-antitoxin system AbiEi family antitoxin [Methanoregula sp.]
MFTKKEHPLNSEHGPDLVANLFSKKATDIIRVLLVNYPKTWMLRDLAKESGTALGYTSRVSNTLISQRLALRASARSELKLMAPEDLLKRWATFSHFVANTAFVEYYTSEQDIGKFLSRLKYRGAGEYALTGLAGALLVEPFVRPTNTHIYIRKGSDAGKLAHDLGLMPVEENGNVKFAIAPSDGIFYGAQEIDGVRVVSDIQLYVDLYNYPARGREAAGELWKNIEKRWNKTQDRV